MRILAYVVKVGKTHLSLHLLRTANLKGKLHAKGNM